MDEQVRQTGLDEQARKAGPNRLVKQAGLSWATGDELNGKRKKEARSDQLEIRSDDPWATGNRTVSVRP